MTLKMIGVSIVFLLCGCAEDSFVGPRSDAGGDSCTSGDRRCLGATLQNCQNGKWQLEQRCDRACSETLGRCAECEPNAMFCNGDDVMSCAADGTTGQKVKTCKAGECQNGVCQDPCSIAAQGRGYLGCEYWPTVTTNRGLASQFEFAVVVSNPQKSAVDITVSRGSQNISTTTVAAEGLKTIVLPWVNELKIPGGPDTDNRSQLVKGGAYRLVSSLPVTVYQFNPLEYQIGGEYSFSNDASLLLPHHVLDTEYIVVTRPSSVEKKTKLFGSPEVESSPGFFAVVATRPGKTQVKITFSGRSQVGTGGIQAYRKGDKASFDLEQGDVLQILSYQPGDCAGDSQSGNRSFCKALETDLTGSKIESDQPIAVFTGHDCTYVPYNIYACDHLEEQSFPLRTWGRKYHATHTASSKSAPSLYRIVSAEDDNEITFSGGVHPPVSLAQGAHVEFTTDKDFEIRGSKRLSALQFMVGQDFSGSAAQGAPGDPAMAFAVPVEQYRSSYRFLAPESFEQNYVNVIAPIDATITLDGNPVTGFSPIADTNYQVAKVSISGGNHTIEGTRKFGITVYGVGSYTSYLYPGGLDLNLLL
jgi:hypothetical protein